MGLVLRPVETRADGGTRSVDVLELSQPGNLCDIADLGLTLPEAREREKWGRVVREGNITSE
jgi:hypothetical protein